MLSDKALKNVQATLASCDELINGRFIFAENIIAKILQNISESDEIYSLIAECMQNFNFDREFNRAKVKLPTKDGYFIMPESKAIVLPLVFCILVDIRDRKINFHEFVKNYFTSENMNEFENFSQTIIVPFRNAIAYCFDLDGATYKQTTDQVTKDDIKEPVENSENKEVEMNNNELDESKVNCFLDGVKLICNQMLVELNSDKKIKDYLKNDIEYLILNILDCVSKIDIKNLSAFIVAVDYVTKPVKCLKFLAQELRQKLMEFYS